MKVEIDQSGKISHSKILKENDRRFKATITLPLIDLTAK